MAEALALNMLTHYHAPLHCACHKTANADGVVINRTADLKAVPRGHKTGAEPVPDLFTHNRLLKALSAEVRSAVIPDLEVIDLAYRKVLYRPHDSAQFVYFPLKGVLSVLAVTGDSPGVEVASVGREGMANVNLFLGADNAQCEAICQAPATVARLSAQNLSKHTANCGEFSQLLLRYTSVYLGQLSQSVACSRLHPLEERCARWLLTMQDRAGDQFPITHEFLSDMLGVRRATVTVAAGILQKAGLIRYTRGKMMILNPAGLEEASCECYRTVRKMFDRLVPANTLVNA